MADGRLPEAVDPELTGPSGEETGGRSPMQTRITDPAVSVAGAMEALQALGDAVGKSGVPHSTVHLVGMRASQINGCGVCLDGAWRFQRTAGETDERLFALAGWREAPYYSDAERAALALAEAVTRLADHPDPVPDEIWDEAARHHDEEGLAALLLSIATTNVFNRLNAPTRQIAGARG